MSEDRITFTLHHLVNELDRIADGILRREFALTYSQFLFLVSLQEKGTLDVTSLARALGVSKAAVSKRVPWFQERQLVEIEGDTNSSRRVLISISSSGEKLVTEAASVLDSTFISQASQFHGFNLDELHHNLQEMLGQIRSFRP